MNRNLCIAAFSIGLLTVAWIGFGYVGSHPLALTMTAIIAAVYVAGAREMLRYHQATASLIAALTAIPSNLTHLGDWLDRIPASLQNPVRLRIEGERVGLPGPPLTPYLVGLLVMLGMLGTFLGMVVTLSGVGITLENTTDLQTIRSSLSAPIKGLGLAFGTSVAGVSASAMLGLISALCRRERQQATQLLDATTATSLRAFSLVHQRQETFKALQYQAQALPDVVDKLQALMQTLERQNQQLNERVIANQESFYRDVKGAYTELAGSVGQSLRNSLLESARIAGETIKPIAEATMSSIARESQALQSRMADSVKAHLDGLSERFETTARTVESGWNEALASHARANESQAESLQRSLTGFTEAFEQRSAALLATLKAELATADQQRLASLSQSLEAMAASLQREWQQAGAQTLEQQQRICATLETTARDITTRAQAHADKTIGEVARLMETAAEAPRAAAEVIAQLRQEISGSIARDNALLEERGRIMETLNTLLDAINHGSAEQRAAIDALVASSADVLQRVSSQFMEKIGSESDKLADVAAQVTGSAVEVSSLGEALNFAVQQFSAANTGLIENLQRIEASLDKSMARSDEQLAYYVAQAREIIDLSIMSQKQIVDDLQQLSSKQFAMASEVQ